MYLQEVLKQPLSHEACSGLSAKFIADVQLQIVRPTLAGYYHALQRLLFQQPQASSL